jgi:hypothetical protein
MWIKFDGKYIVIRHPETNKEVTLPYATDRWFHVVETDTKLYIDGKETEE